MPNLETLNRVYWVRKVTEPSPRPHRVSTRILGFGIFMVGVVILSIGLIIGLEFPLYVSQRILKDQCILDENHVFYEQWYRDEKWIRFNRLYYWTVNNLDEFMAGEKPRLVERGPYVYEEKRQLVNVVFEGTCLSYQTMMKQTFREDLTHRECGPHCSQTDTLTVLNTDYLRRMYMFDGLSNYSRRHIGSYLSYTLKNHQNDFQRLQDLYTFIGCLDENCRNASTNATARDLSDLVNISIGNWFKANDTSEKTIVIARWSDSRTLQGNPFSSYSTRVLYNILEQTTFTNHSDIMQCTSISQKGYMRLGATHFNNAALLNTTAHLKDDNFTNYHSTVLEIRMSQSCGVMSATVILMEHMLQNSEWNFPFWSFSICEGLGKPCIDVRDTYNVVFSLIKTLYEFTETHLYNLTFNLVTSQTKHQMVHKRSQKELALGYSNALFDWEISDGAEVKGILSNHVNFREAIYSRPKIKVSTCLYHGSSDNNMVVKEYNGSQFAPSELYQGQTTHRYTSFTDEFPRSNKCKACIDPPPSSDHYDVFIEDLYRGFVFDNPQQTERLDVRLFRYELSKGAFHSTQHYCETQDVSMIYQFPAWVSNPYFQGSRCPYGDVLVTTSDTDQHRSYLEMEPWSGRIWKKNIQLQISAEVKPNAVPMTTGNASGISYINVPIPVYWIERRSEIVQAEVDYFKHKVARLMSVSCGGMIGVTVAAIFTMVLSVFVCLLSNRKNRVRPLPQELSNNERL